MILHTGELQQEHPWGRDLDCTLDLLGNLYLLKIWEGPKTLGDLKPFLNTKAAAPSPEEGELKYCKKLQKGGSLNILV